LSYYIQLLKEKYADYWHFSSKKFTKKEVKVKGTTQNSILQCHNSNKSNIFTAMQVSLFTKGNKKKQAAFTTRSYTLVFIFEIPSTYKIKREPLLLLLWPCPF
jgi:hypothetical protein